MYRAKLALYTAALGHTLSATAGSCVVGRIGWPHATIGPVGVAPQRGVAPTGGPLTHAQPDRHQSSSVSQKGWGLPHGGRLTTQLLHSLHVFGANARHVPSPPSGGCSGGGDGAAEGRSHHSTSPAGGAAGSAKAPTAKAGRSHIAGYVSPSHSSARSVALRGNRTPAANARGKAVGASASYSTADA